MDETIRRFVENLRAKNELAAIVLIGQFSSEQCDNDCRTLILPVEVVCPCVDVRCRVAMSEFRFFGNFLDQMLDSIERFPNTDGML
jgi:hypothetical protein